MEEYINKADLIDWLEKVDGCLADGTVEAGTLYKQMITDVRQFGGIKTEVLLPLTKEDLRHLINDRIAYLNLMENQGRTSDCFAYTERKNCLERMIETMRRFEIREAICTVMSKKESE